MVDWIGNWSVAEWPGDISQLATGKAVSLVTLQARIISNQSPCSGLSNPSNSGCAQVRSRMVSSVCEDSSASPSLKQQRF